MPCARSLSRAFFFFIIPELVPGISAGISGVIKVGYFAHSIGKPLAIVVVRPVRSSAEKFPANR